MEKDEVLSLCRCVILCPLAPVIANLHQPFTISYLYQSWLFPTTIFLYSQGAFTSYLFRTKAHPQVVGHTQVTMNIIVRKTLTA
jgi:hypothetical protein